MREYLGNREYQDMETGEIRTSQVWLDKVQGDRNFKKVWLQSFIEEMEDITNKRTKVAYYVIDHLNKQNMFIGTYKNIAAETGISERTVQQSMEALQRHNPPFLTKKQNGVYMVNPKIMCGVDSKTRGSLVVLFDEEVAENSKDDTIQQLDGQTEFDAKNRIDTMEKKVVNE